MSEELKKTMLLPRHGQRMAYNTVVMERPPEMTELLKASGAGQLGVLEVDSKATQELRRSSLAPPLPSVAKPLPQPTVVKASPPPIMSSTMPPRVPVPTSERSARPQATHVPPARAGKMTSIGALRTRMENVKATPTFNSAIVASPSHRAPPPPPPPGSTLHVAPLASSPQRSPILRKAIIIGIVAVVLGVLMVLPMSGTTNTAEAVPQTGEVPSESANDAEPPPKARVITENTTLTPTLVTEQQAGTMLLEGRRGEALALYRELANSSQSTPGVNAMLEVLSQKVTTP